MAISGSDPSIFADEVGALVNDNDPNANTIVDSITLGQSEYNFSYLRLQ